MNEPAGSELKLTAGRIAREMGASVVGDGEMPILGASTIDDALNGDIVFAESPQYAAAALKSRASVVIVKPESADGSLPEGKALLVAENPRSLFVRALECLERPICVQPGIHPSAVVSPEATVGAESWIGANVVIEAGAVLGERVRVYPGVYIGANCRVGDDTVLHPHVTLYHDVSVGARCILHAGVVLGADGFGFIPVGHALKKIPHLGSVEIGDDVEMGANSCVDRGKVRSTVIGSGTKIDNLVHVGHNVRVGRSCILVAQVGIAGSVELEDGVVLAGQAGIIPHVHIGAGSTVASQSGVWKDLPAGSNVSGIPARPHRQRLRETAALEDLPEALRKLRALEKRLAALEEAGQAGEKG